MKVKGHRSGPLETGQPALEPLLTIEETGKILKVSRATIYRLIERKELKPTHIGRRILFSQNELRRYLRGLE